MAALEAAWMYRSAVDALRAREEALAAATHDLRGPLGTASMGASMLRTRLDEAVPKLADELDLAHRVERACKRVSGLLETMLGRARGGAPRDARGHTAAGALSRLGGASTMRARALRSSRSSRAAWARSPPSRLSTRRT